VSTLRTRLPAPGFARSLGAIAAAGLALRIVYAALLTPDLRGLGDSAFYHGAANALADGRGFVDPASGLASALHPPLTALLLAPAGLLGIDSYLAHRLVMALVGAAAIAVVGLLARRLAGDRAGLIAAALAAVYPALVSSDTAVMPETPFGLAVALALLAAYAYLERPGARTAALLGAAIGLSALARGEGLLLLVLLALPLVLGRRSQRARRDPRALAAAVVACALVVAPWTIRNLATFDRPVPLSTNEGTLLAGANCADTYGGRDIGSWSIRCVTPGTDADESAAAARYRREGIDYATGHAERLPLVAGARLLRTLGLLQPVRQAEHAEGRGRTLEVLAVPAFWGLALLAVTGALALRRRSVPVWPLAAAIGVALAATLLGYGVPRFRQPADIAVVVLAAVAIDAALARRRGGGAQPEPVGVAGAGSATASPRAAGLRSGSSRLSDSAGRSTT
jgi:4-amino-4-deoxy-L-arabinose transferase-like glycosyltransferase